MKICSIVGARPQFIKCAALSRKLRLKHEEIIIHTGQHYSANMSQKFYDELDIFEPNLNLGVGSASHGVQTAKMLTGIEKALIEIEPDLVLLFGDTNSTLAGALAASKLAVNVAHVEAGLRSFDRSMPEELNRIVTDHLSGYLFCPTSRALSNLEKEGLADRAYVTGDVMYDLALSYIDIAKERSSVLRSLKLENIDYVLATIHRASNTDNPERLKSILGGLANSGLRVVLPLHPRTREAMQRNGISESAETLTICDPVGYLDMLMLEANAKIIATDSGGVQKEAYFIGVPCVTLRDSTEWVETVESGWNVLAGYETESIVKAINRAYTVDKPQVRGTFYGGGNASEKIVEIIDRIT